MAGTRLVLLGTGGGPRASTYRAAPAQAIVVDGHIYIVDFGNGIGRQLAATSLDVGDVRAGFLTHHHSDHNADIGTLFLTEWARLRGGVTLIGPPPLRQSIASFFEANRTDIDLRMAHTGRSDLRDLLRPREITGTGPVYHDERVTVTAALVSHPPVDHAFAYRFDTRDRSIVVSGDTTPCDALVRLASGADTLVHEAIALDRIDTIADVNSGSRTRSHLRESHTSVDEVGAVATAAGVRTLVLSHLVPDDGSVTESEWAERASRGFDGEVIVGRDLACI